MKNKILMITCQFMPDVFGGAEKQCSRVSSELADQGYNVTILSSLQNKKVPLYSIPDVKIHRIYTRVPPDLLGRWSLFSVYWCFRVLYWGLIHRNTFDIIHCHQGKFGAAVACLLGKITKKPVLIKIGNSEFFMDLLCLQRKKIIGPLLSSMIVRSRPTFVAITKVIADNLISFGCNSIVEIPNGITNTLIQNNDQDSSLDKNHIDFFYHGRIESIKRLDVLLEAYALLRSKTNKTLTLHIIGNGSCLKSVKTKSTSLGIQDEIKFHGESKNVISLINKYHIFVNASIAEGFSNSLLEAMLLGKVLVSTPVSGSNEAINNSVNGYITDNFTAESLSQSMLKAITLYEREASQVKKYSQHLLETRFSMPIIIEKYKHLYQHIEQTG